MARRRTGFLVGEALRYGWDTWRRHVLGLTGTVVAALVVPYLPGAFGTALGDEAGWLTGVLMLASLLLAVLVNMGLLQISLKAYAGKDILVSDLFGQWRRLPYYLVASLLYGLIVLGGTLLFVIPGFVWAIKFQYYAFLVLEDRSPIEALKESAQLTSGYKWDLLGFQYVLSTIVMLGVVLAGVGVLVAIPVALVANAAVFRRLQSR